MYVRMKLAPRLLAVLCTSAISTFVYGKTPAEFTRVKQATACMLKVLMTVPGVSGPRQGITVGIPGQVLPAPGRIPRPYVEYRAAEMARWTTPTRFIFESASKNEVYFQAMLPGMVTNPRSMPDTHITDIIIKKWKAQCGVQADILFE
jgi:hypothetical protein